MFLNPSSIAENATLLLSLEEDGTIYSQQLLLRNQSFPARAARPPAAVLTTHLVLRSQLLRSAPFDTERVITAFRCIKSVVRPKLFNCYSVDMTRRVRQSEKRKIFEPALDTSNFPEPPAS